jgi:hypothetical protein
MGIAFQIDVQELIGREQNYAQDEDVRIGFILEGEEASLWQAHAFQQVVKARVGAQRVIEGSGF